MKDIYNAYKVLDPKGNKYRINLNNGLIRALMDVYRADNNIPYFAPLSDDERTEFEKIVLHSGIESDDTFDIARKKYMSAVENLKEKKPKAGYTSADVQKLKNKILGKEVG